MAALLADIGGTNARFALLDGGAVADVRVLATADYPDLAAAARAYLDGRAVDRAALAVAGPVDGGTVALTNRDWSFEPARLQTALDVATLRVVNDFTAQALAVPHLGPGDTVAVGGGCAADGAPVAVIGPGTGLGVSGLVPDGRGGRIALATEGGHVTLAAATDREAAVIAELRRHGGHVSAERVLSGPGLVTLYHALAALDGRRAGDPAPDDITRAAADRSDPVALETVALFCGFLGTVAADLALTLGARGGVYVAGGIVPQLGTLFSDSGFRARFEDKGRFTGYLAAIPTLVVTAANPALTGLAALLSEGG